MLIKDEGPRTAQLVLIGEAGGANEAAQGRPFVGAAGWKLAGWWREVGLARGDIYITNVVPYQPRNNNINEVPEHEMAGFVESLHDRLGRLSDPVVLVPTGNTALRALTGKNGITKHRGSIYPYVTRRGQTCKVIPTIHPAAIFRQPGWERRCLSDWRRIRGDLAYRDLRTPDREHIIKPTMSDVRQFYQEAASRANILAIDIETPRELTYVETGRTKKDKPKLKKVWGTPRVACVGFCFEPHLTMTIPTTEAYWHGELDTVWDLICDLCMLPCAKALQNGLFDAFYLAEDHDIPLVNYRWDTRWMHATLDPLDAHDLAYLASVDTRQPFWKDEAKDPDEIQKYASNWDALLTYNGIDAAVTRELAEVYEGRLGAIGQTHFYRTHYQSLFQPLLSLMRGGIQLSDRARRLEHARLTAQCIAIQDALTAIAGEPLYGKKDLSTKKLATFLYDTLKLPRQLNRKTGGTTTNEVTVRRLMLRYPKLLEGSNEHDGPGKLILNHRRYSKLTSFIKDGVSDPDGRVRCQYGFTETGRLTSSRNPKRTGQNLQNVDRALRHLYRPNESTLFLEVDLSQAESRVVYALSGDPTLIGYARTAPHEFDDHARIARIIFARQEITKEERYFGKRTNHASNYGQRGKTMSDTLLKDGIVRDADECDAWIETRLRVDAGIPSWQKAVRRLVIENKMLGNSWGRVIDFTHERLSDELYRQAYAWQPQSEIADLTNQWGFLPLWKWLAKQGMKSQINLQTHDSLTISVTPDEAYDVACFLRDSLERPRRYNGTKLFIPVEIKLGRSWATDREWKQFPERHEFESAYRELIR